MPPYELPPWVPSPVSLLADRDETGARWVHGLTPLLFMLAWAVAFAAVHCDRSWFAGGFFPLAALVVCVAVVPHAKAKRRGVTARSAQAAYLALASLTPWLMFAWTTAARMDNDGGAGGALGGSALVMSSLFLLGVMPVTLGALGMLPTLRGRRWPVFASAVPVAGLALVAAVFSARHPTAASLGRYQGSLAQAPPIGDSPRHVQVVEGATLHQRRAGQRCVTRLAHVSSPPSPYLAHRCDSPLTVYHFPRGDLDAWRRSARPVYFEMVFVTTEGQVIGNKAAPRYLLFTAPLWEWIVGALAGVALALFTQHRTRRALAAWRRLPTREGTARDGAARCDDGTVVQLPDALARHTGPVVVLGDPTHVAPFREVPRDSVIVLAGSRRGWDEALAGSESVAMSFALAVTWLPAAPLLASPFLGMLSPLP